MDPAGKGEVTGSAVAHDVERVRTVVDLGVPVRRPDQRDHKLALGHRLAGQLERFEREPAGALDRGVEPARKVRPACGGG